MQYWWKDYLDVSLLKEVTGNWFGDDAMELLEYFAVAVTNVLVAVTEILPMAVTFNFAFALKKMMNDKALVRYLADCESMGSATTICSDKIGTLTTNHMTVVKACICGEIMEVSSSKSTLNFGPAVPDSAMSILLNQYLITLEEKFLVT